MGRRLGYALALCVLLFLATGDLYAQQPQAAEAPVQPIFLTSKAPSFPANGSVRLFEDAKKNYTFGQVLAAFKAGKGKPVEDGGPAFIGYSSSGHWLVFNVYNRNPAKNRWMLDFGARLNGTSGIADKVLVFTDADLAKPVVREGRAVKNKVQPEGQDKNAIPLTFEPGQARTVAIYVEPAAGVALALAPEILDLEYFSEKQSKLSLENGALAIMMLIAVCVLLLFQAHRQTAVPSFLIVYLFANYLIFHSGYEIVALGNNTGAVILPLLHAAAALVAIHLAFQVLLSDESKTAPARLGLYGFKAAIILSALIGMTTGMDMGAINIFLIRATPPLLSLFIVALGVTAVLRSDRPLSLLFTASWVLLAFAQVMCEAMNSGLLSYAPAINTTYWFAFVLHFTTLAFSSLRFIGITAETAQRELEESKRRSEEESELRKTKELADQTRLLGVLQREKELMADLRNREGERLHALRRAKEFADQASKSKSDFLAVISHEIRTPMTGVMGMIRLLLDTPLDDKQKEFAKTIQYAGDGLITLLNDILDFSKVEEGKMQIESLDFDLIKVVESTILLMSGRAEEKKIFLKADIDAEVPQALKGDPTRLRQILLNLVSNAIKFTENGGVTLTVRLHDKSGRKPRIYFAVTDTGIGISEDVQKKLFSPYQQADASVARQFGGTGLGLAICKRLVEAMGSSIQISSKLGAGTTFHFILSLDHGRGEFEAAQAEATEKIVPLKLLVVDDNIINQRVVSGLLEKDGHKIVAAGSAEAALAEIKSVTFDAILMDMEMPGSDGVAATGMIRALPDPEKAATAIIAMTANTRQEDVKRCLDGGMNDYLSKPINPEHLRKMLAKHAGGGQAAVQIAPAPAYIPAPAAAEASAAVPAEVQRYFNAEVMGDLKKSLGGAQLGEMMDGLYQKTEELIASAEKAIAENDVKTIGTRGHDIKGMTSNFGLTALSEVSGRLERQAKENFSIDVLAEIVKTLRPLYYDTRSSVEKWMKTS